jgi:hypothetical protein
MSKSLPAPTAASVRADAEARPERYAGLSDAAKHTLAKGARGRLHPDAIKAHNKGKRPNRRYVLGVGVQNKATAQAARAAYVAAGGGKRGPMKPLDAVSKG